MADESQLVAYLQIRLTPEQYVAWREEAKADGRAVSNWVRWVVEQHRAEKSVTAHAERDPHGTQPNQEKRPHGR